MLCVLTSVPQSPGRTAVRFGRPADPTTTVSVVLCVLLLSGCGRSSDTGDARSGSPQTGGPPAESPSVDFAALRPKIDRFCGACHAVPDPDTFPKQAWHDEVAQGYRFYDESQRGDLHPPPMNDVVAYFRHFAPQQLSFPSGQSQATPAPVTFSQRPVELPPGIRNPSVSHLAWFPVQATDQKSLVVCDMRYGLLGQLDLSGNTPVTSTLAQLQHPSTIHPVRFAAERHRGFLVGGLGTFQPGDHQRGRISWLRRRADGSGFDAVVLADQLGRVADVRAADFDGDQKLDLIVAEFGWRKTGRILLLQQTSVQDGVPQFRTTEVDKRHGTIHVPVVDLNSDGRPDFIALVSQEHETIDAFLNIGNGRFDRQRIYQANDPSFGSSGIELIDIDGDADLDVLYTNGDSLDSHYLKPYHAVHWLENRGRFPFTHHEITRLPGISRAIAVDLDRDGDLDIACAAYLPASIIDRQADGKIDALIWLEQRPGQSFARHTIQRAASGYLSLTSGDFNHDGVPDLASGHFQAAGGDAWVSLWLTNGPDRSGRAAAGWPVQGPIRVDSQSPRPTTGTALEQPAGWQPTETAPADIALQGNLYAP